jgi:Cyclic phosphodiesterase-like protein
MKFSVWLCPNQAAGTNWRALIDELSQHHCASITFEPHITIVGAIEIEDENVASLCFCQDLKHHLKGRYPEGIKCNFQSGLESMILDANGERNVQWNQALVATAEETSCLLSLVDSCREFFRLPPAPRFEPQLRRPHMSLFYGIENIPDKNSVQLCENFIAKDLALWLTEPSTLEGVSTWREIARITLY